MGHISSETILLRTPRRDQAGIPVDVTRATQAVGPMRGASQPRLLRCADNHFYIVKFLNNPQHRRVLVNEMLGSKLARRMGLPTPEARCIEVPLDLVESSSSLSFKSGGRAISCSTGLQFGSRYPGAPGAALVTDLLPDKYLRRIRNPEVFPGAIVFDKWTCNCDGRQVIFHRSNRRDKFHYNALLVDQGYCFNGGEWNFPESPLRGLYPRRVVYENVYGWDAFEPFLQRVENLEPEELEQCRAAVPQEWYEGNEKDLDHLLDQLYLRRRKVRQAILDAKNLNPTPFPNWSSESVSSIYSYVDSKKGGCAGERMNPSPAKIPSGD